jgi:hypothetical protein
VVSCAGNGTVATSATISLPGNHDFADVNLGDEVTNSNPPLLVGFDLIQGAYTNQPGTGLTLTPGTQTFILPTSLSQCDNTIPNVTIRQTGENVQGTFCDHIARIELSADGTTLYTYFSAGDEIPQNPAY